MTPNCFIVGAAKAGTSSLYHWLNQHPDVYMSPFKEPGHFCNDLRNPTWIVERNRYQNLFKAAGHHQVVGEASTAYLFSRNAAQNIYDFNPDAKILISLRNPVDMLISLHRHLVYLKRQTEPDFEKAFMGPPVNFDKRYSESFLNYRLRASFHDQVKRFLDVFPPEQVLILLFDDIKSSPSATFTRILEFLKLKPFLDIKLEKQNTSRTFRNKWLHDIVMDPPDWIRRITRPLQSIKVYHRTLQLIDTINSKPTSVKAVSEDFRTYLRHEFSAEINLLSQLIQTDLRAWTAAVTDPLSPANALHT